MFSLHWSDREKILAREAYDAALEREGKAFLQEIRARMEELKDWRDLWEVGETIEHKRRDMQNVYEFSYSQLLLTFAILIRKGFLHRRELEKLDSKKLEAMDRLLKDGD